MNEWKTDKERTDKFLPQIKRILGEQLIQEAPVEEDRDRNTDLVVLRLNAIRIGCRIRKSEYHKKYPGEITIRAWRPSSNKTELQKIIEGWGDYFFYGFEDCCGNYVEHWVLGNLNAFRAFHSRCLAERNYKWRMLGNSDKSSTFLAVNYEIIPGFVVATGGPQW
jgi:hypothetical protein